eukprot:328157-Pyramimonas_sp.AAC.1
MPERARQRRTCPPISEGVHSVRTRCSTLMRDPHMIDTPACMLVNSPPVQPASMTTRFPTYFLRSEVPRVALLRVPMRAMPSKLFVRDA